MEILSASLGGTILGFLIKSTYDYFNRQNDRRDKYIFSLLEKRFSVYQEANIICEKLKRIVHDKSDTHTETLNDARKWYSHNHLYFTPSTRKVFNILISDVQFYGVNLENYFFTCNSSGRDSLIAKEKHTELMASWSRIMKDTQENLENDMNFYFEKIQ